VENGTASATHVSLTAGISLVTKIFGKKNEGTKKLYNNWPMQVSNLRPSRY
jgi:hypothetical protein